MSESFKLGKDFFSRVEEEEEEEEECKIPENILKEMQREIRRNDPFPLEETKTRNILIVGRSRSGKTTAVGVLKDPCYQPKEMSIFSDTVDPKFQSFSLDDKDKNVKYTVNIIDTPGLKEVKKIGEDARSDAIILNTITYCLKNEITKINLLLIFISFETGVNQDDLDSFKTFLEKFENPDIKIGVCITRAENKQAKWRKNIMSQLQEHHYFSKVLKQNNVKILFCGCAEDVRSGVVSTTEDALNLYKKVAQMRSDLIRHIFSSEDQVKLTDLPITAGVRENLDNLFEQQAKLLDQIENASDFGTGLIKEKVYECGINVGKILHNEGLFIEEKYMTKWQIIRQRMKSALSKIPPEMKKDFSGTLQFD